MRLLLLCSTGRSAVLLLLSIALTGTVTAVPGVTVGFVVDGPWERNEEVLELFTGELESLLSAEFNVRIPPEKTLTGDFTPRAVEDAIDRLLDDPEVDVVVALGVLASAVAARRTSVSKPLFAPFVLDHLAQDVAWESGTSGVRNLCYMESPSTIDRELGTFHEIVGFQKLAFLTTPAIAAEVGGPRAMLSVVAQERGFEVVVVPAVGDARATISAIPADADAVYLTPMQQLGSGEFKKLVDGLIERRLPSFSMLGRRDVEAGVMAGLASSEWFLRLARRLALNLQRILLGEDAGTLPTAITRLEELVLNMETARAIGFYPSFGILTEAVLINDTRRRGARTLTLLGAIEEALAVNQDLAAADRMVAAGSEEIGKARSNLLPQIELGGLGTWIDEDRAAASFGSAAEQTVSGSATLRQVLWSEPAWSNLSTQKDLQRARELERRQIHLDTTLEAATAYLNVLRAVTFERLQKDNLKLSRSNLMVAEVREVIGASGPAEVYRWESQIASEQKSVIEANAQRNLAEIALNRILNRPLEESFRTTEADLDDPSLPTSDPRLTRYVGDPWSFRIFRRFLVEVGVENSPEIRRIDAAISAQQRQLASSRRAFYSPTIALQGEFSRRFWEGGEGSDGGVADLGAPFDDLFVEPDETEWSLGLNLSIPLTTGGRRRAERRAASETLERLLSERKALAERIEQRIRASAHTAGASYAGIALARRSAEAANQSLELVTAAYSRGVVPIIDLLDAQNATLSAELAAATAVYDFLVDLMEVERATGAFVFNVPEEERQGWIERLEGYLQESREEQ